MNKLLAINFSIFSNSRYNGQEQLDFSEISELLLHCGSVCTIFKD
ncbi:hypothetical protein PPRY_a4340 [Pseudoalteromonas prydzensis ACAM 620]|nr:hypothetical protein [Pseudoalteromonas prydzensis ACAM 620]